MNGTTPSLSPAKPGRSPDGSFDPPEAVAWLGREFEFVEAVRSVVRDDVFDGVPLALAVPSFLTLLWRHGRLQGRGCKRTTSACALARALAHPHGGLWLGRRPSAGDCARLRGRVLIAGVNAQGRTRRHWKPLAEALGPEDCLLVAPGRSQLGQPPHELPRVAVTDFPGRWWVTRLWVLARLNRWLQRLKAVCGTFGFAPAARWRLAAALVSQVNRIGAVSNLERLLKPKAVVVGWDRDPFGAVLCAALGSRGVPTFTLVHGAFGVQNRDYFLPLGARYVLSWGDIQSELLQAAGVPGERLLPVGLFEPRPVRRELSPSERLERVRLLGLDPDKPVLVVGLTCLAEKDRLTWAPILRDLAGRLPEYSILVRLHPSNTERDFAGMVETHGRLRLLDGRLLSAAQTLELGDAVLVDSSSFGFDALQRDVPLVAMNPPDGSGFLAIQLEALREGAALPARDTAEAAAWLRRLLSDAPFRAELVGRARGFVDRYVCAYGHEALRRAQNALSSTVANRALESAERLGGHA